MGAWLYTAFHGRRQGYQLNKAKAERDRERETSKQNPTGGRAGGSVVGRASGSLSARILSWCRTPQ
jgi:hypothetical protein